MAGLSSAATGDKRAYTNHVVLVEKERDLLDRKGTIEDEIKWLDQTLSFLILNTTSPNDPASQAEKERGYWQHSKLLSYSNRILVY